WHCRSDRGWRGPRVQRCLLASRLHGAVQSGHHADLVRVPQRDLRPRRQRRLRSASARAGEVHRQRARRGRRRGDRRVADMSVIDWVDQRLDLAQVRHFVAEKGVPVHAQKIWYYLGGMTLFLFGVQVFTGILLLLYYRPSAAEAYESVQFIVTQVQFGWLI